MRPWHERLGARPTLEGLNRLAGEAGLRTASGRPLRFVAPAASDPYYEVNVFETGCVQTRADSLHDLFNALAWLAFPLTKARLNALHAAEIPREGGRRGRLRDLLTIFDEGGAIVAAPPELAQLVSEFRWKDLFWKHRAEVVASMKLRVLGHAILEQALEPRAGITCKVVFVQPGADADAAAAAWLEQLPAGATPRDMAPLPLFGYPGWLRGSERAEFYDDERYFRPLRRSAAQ